MRRLRFRRDAPIWENAAAAVNWLMIAAVLHLIAAVVDIIGRLL